MREYQALIEIALNAKDKFEQERLQQKLKDADKEFRELTNMIQVAFIGRLVHLRHDPERIFEVKSYGSNNSEITLRAVYDDYQILLEADCQMAACLPKMNSTKFKREYAMFDKT